MATQILIRLLFGVQSAWKRALRSLSRLTFGALLGAMLAGPTTAQAAVTAKDVQIAGRVLAFMSPPLFGNLKIGIVYQPGNAASVADERSLVSIIGAGLQIQGVNLIAVPVPVAQLAVAQVDVYFLTANLGADAAKVGEMAALRKRLCITTDISAADAGACAVGVESEPSVTITINKVASESSGIEFVTAFLLMVTVI